MIFVGLLLLTTPLFADGAPTHILDYYDYEEEDRTARTNDIHFLVRTVHKLLSIFQFTLRYNIGFPK